jgi:hypothetical protein
VAWAVAGLVLVVGLTLFGGQLVMTALGEGGRSQPGQSPSGAASEGPDRQPLERLRIAGATGFDPAPGNGEENSERAELAVDGDGSTAWNTETYYDPFGPAGLKNGVGLLLDLGKPVDVSTVSVTVQGGPTDLEWRVADRVGSGVDDFELVDEVSSADGRAVLRRPGEPVTARYVLVWLTSLPSVGGSNYRGEISEIVLRG